MTFQKNPLTAATIAKMTRSVAVCNRHRSGVAVPVGLNVFVIANVVGKKAPVDKIFAGITRFLGVDLIVLIPMAAR